MAATATCLPFCRVGSCATRPTSQSGVPCGRSEVKHKIRYCTRSRIDYAQAACAEVHLADKEGMVGEDSNADKIGDELGDDVVGG